MIASLAIGCWQKTCYNAIIYTEQKEGEIKNLFLEYFYFNFATLSILLVLVVFMFLNRKSDIPSANMYKYFILIILILTVTDYANEKLAYKTAYGFEPVIMEADMLNTIHTVFSVIGYWLRPVVILIQLFIIAPNKRWRLPLCLPAVVNTVVFSMPLFGVKAGFVFINNRWHPAPLHATVYLVVLIYLVILIVFSGIYFRKKDTSRCQMLMLMLFLSLGFAWLEYNGFFFARTTEGTVICGLAYYIYLSTIYQQELTETITRKELAISQAEMKILRNQIQPHFIFNTLTIIRSLVRTDRKKAIEAVNTFSKYLRTHINTIQEDELIPFDDEIKNVCLYLELAQADYPGRIEIVYDLKVTDFRIPPLILEPIVENAVQHGISRNGGRIIISTFTENDEIVIRISDNGTAKKELTEKAVTRTGVGLDNTQKRIELKCEGKMAINITDSGCIVTIRLPNRRKQHEDIDRG